MLGVKPGTGQLPWLEEVYVTPVPAHVPHDFPSILKPPSRAPLAIGGKLLVVFIMRTAPATTPYGRATSSSSSSSPSKKSKSSKSSSSSSSSSSSVTSSSSPLSFSSSVTATSSSSPPSSSVPSMTSSTHILSIPPTL